MKLLVISLIVFTISGCTKGINIEKDTRTKNRSFQQVWNQVISDKVNELPNNQVSFLKLKDRILQDAKRTLDNHSDILEPFDKLAHPNGICFKGVWNINTDNKYSGYFKKDTQGLIIVRASTALSNTTSDDNRAFGFAGKIFPTMNKDKINQENSANFFLIDNLGGTNAKHYTDVILTNEPPTSFTFTVLKNLLYAIKVALSFEKADNHSTIRQLYEISELGENKNTTKIITPKWMKLDIKNIEKVDEKDFRDELKIKDNKELIFNIYVASKIIDKNKDWKQIGTINLDTSIISTSCDHRLHFHHPKYKEIINE